MKNGEQPAFAKAAFYHPDGGIDSPQQGLTKREYLAAMAMQGLLSTMSFNAKLNIKVAECIAKESLLAADELLKQLSNDSPDLFKDMGMDSVKIDL